MTKAKPKAHKAKHTKKKSHKPTKAAAPKKASTDTPKG